MTAMTGFANLYNCPVQYNGLPDSGPSTNGHSSTNIDIGTQLEGGREGGGTERGRKGGREGGRLNKSIDHIHVIAECISARLIIWDLFS